MGRCVLEKVNTGVHLCHLILAVMRKRVSVDDSGGSGDARGYINGVIVNCVKGGDEYKSNIRHNTQHNLNATNIMVTPKLNLT